MAKAPRAARTAAPRQPSHNGIAGAAFGNGPPGHGGMEVGEAIRRILWVHLVLVLALTLLGGAMGYAIHAGDSPRYAASARVVLDTADTTGQSDSQAYADTARAIVTSPSHVTAALRSIHAARDAGAVAANEVTVQPLATSSVEQIIVTDRDPTVAAALANTLAADLVRTRLQYRLSGGSPSAQLAAIQASIAAVDAQLASLRAQLPRASPTDVPNISALISSLLTERASLVQEQSSLATQRSPLVVDPATVPQHPLPQNRWLDVALGLLLGLAAGVAVAAVWETARPTLASPRAVARAAGGPHLGELTRRRGRRSLSVSALARSRLLLLAEDAGVRTVEVTAATQRVDPGALAEDLQRPPTPAREWAPVPEGVDAPAPGPAPAVRVVAAGDVSPSTGRPAATGVVLVAPSIVKKAEVDRALELLPYTGWPLLGVLTYRTAPRWFFLAR